MSAALIGAARDLIPFGGDLARTGERVCDQLSSPLRVAVVGRVSAGKSTLVNALLERTIAPTGAGETTMVPAWFSYGRWVSALALTPGSDPVALTLDGQGRLPERLPSGPPGPGTRLDVTLPLPLLREAMVVDAPGIASTSDGVSQRTAALLTEGTDGSAAHAEALVVVLTGTLHPDEADAVASLAAAVPNVGVIPAVAALTRVDTFDRDPEQAFKAGADLAADIAAAHPSLFAAVVPVAGLMAETARTGALGEADARALGQLAAHWPAQLRADVLADAQIFGSLDCPVDATARARLVGLLGLAGVRICLDYLTERPRASAAELTSLLRAQSGIDALLAALRTALAGRADLLKAAVAVRTLQTLRARPDIPAPAAAALGDALDDPVLAPVELAAALAGLPAARRQPPAALAAEAVQASRGPLPASDPATVAARVSAWRTWAATADGPGRRVADAMCRVWQSTVEGLPR